MRIGLLAPPWILIPPPAYGGIERVVALQAASLSVAGHDVTLVAAPGSAIPGVEVVSPLDCLPAQIGMATDEWRHVLGGLARPPIAIVEVQCCAYRAAASSPRCCPTRVAAQRRLTWWPRRSSCDS